jgi:penicillin-binding protein 2
MRQDDDERTQDLPPGGGFGGRGTPRDGQRGPSSFGGLVPDDTDTFPPLGGSPDLFPNYRVRQPPKPPGPPRNRGPLIAAISVVALIAVVGGVLFTTSRVAPKSGIGRILGCGDGSPCQAAESYLKEYTSGNYEAMYGLTSSASRQRFNDPKILSGNYQDAHDYIVNRTKGIISAAQITSVSASSSDVKQSSDTAATVPARIVYNSARLGTFTEDVTIPLVHEQGAWHVTWTPGLIFPQMDDQADPYYQRHVRLSTAVGRRGTIYDRDNNVLAKDDTVYQVGVIPAKIGDEGKLLQALSGALKVPSNDIKSAYQGGSASNFHLIRTVPPQLYNQISSTLSGLAGVQVNPTTSRVYPYGADLAAVTGYVSIIQPADQKNDKDHYYDNGDLVGHTGIEAWGEKYLRPTKGGALKIVNANADGSDGATAYTVASRDGTNGDDIHTTINLAEQEAAIKGLNSAQYQGQKGGGAMAVDPASGEVLVFASQPACDPNDFALGFHDGTDACLSNQTDPLNNHVLRNAVPIGSVFKTVTLATGLENGISATDTFTCHGSYLIPGQSKPSLDHLITGHGTLTMSGALAPSCDVIFWMVAVQVGDKDPNALPKMARGFGYGAPTKIVGVPDGVEVSGLVPDPDYVQHLSPPANWAPVDSANLGIGQGYFQATIAQVAMASAAIGNNGVRMQPRLVTSITAGSAVVQTFDAKQIGTLPLSADHLAMLQAAMAGTTYGDGTTATVFKNYPIAVAGKTGTAQACDNCSTPPHTWFSFYAPVAPLSGPPQAAKIAGAAAFFNSGGEGGPNAGPVTRAIMDVQFKVSGQ